MTRRPTSPSGGLPAAGSPAVALPVVALLVTALCAGTPTPPVSAAPDGCTPVLTDGQDASRRPVVLVHGWLGDPLSRAATVLRQRLGDRVTTYEFDYGARSLAWASDVADCLAGYLAAVSKLHRDTRGDGQVVVVAHSTGAEAVRYALRGQARDVPRVITVGAPDLGTPWGGTGLATAWQQANARGRTPPSTADGARCLAPHDKGGALPQGCGDLPPWLPAGTGLHQIAADVTVDRTLFGVGLYSLDLGGDGMVPVTSAHGYPTSGPGETSGVVVTTSVHRCRVDYAALFEDVREQRGTAAALGLDQVPGKGATAVPITPAVGDLLVAATRTASCSQARQMADDKVLAQVGDAVSAAADDLRGPTGATPADYRSDSTVEQYFFRSPSGRFACGVVAQPLSAGCRGDTAPTPPRPSSCAADVEWGKGLSVDAAGAVDFLCGGGAVYSDGGEAKVLPYGAQLSALGFTCVSREDGVRCSHDTTGHGFRIAAESHERF
ncbi:DUF6636 domain-containing protein [Actinosynnema sp. NPDC020468]|uniref:DUF6636 domain-containing protein n=1 Tax=Actinosynnema sp. NPDC020468 TaxID=3154488 RepID=UPI00340FB8C8